MQNQGDLTLLLLEQGDEALPGMEPGAAPAGGMPEAGAPSAAQALPDDLAKALFGQNPANLRSSYRKIVVAPGLPKLTQGEIQAAVGALQTLLKAMPPTVLRQVLTRIGVLQA